MAGVGFPAGARYFPSSTGSKPALGPTQPPIQLVPGTLSLGVKRLGSDTYYSPRSSAEVKNGGSVPPLSNTTWWCLIKHRDSFTFLAYFPYFQKIKGRL
jgi:hypothetical protein